MALWFQPDGGEPVNLSEFLLTYKYEYKAVPSVSATTDTIPGRPGELFYGAQADPLDITLDCVLKGHAAETVDWARRNLARAVSPGTPGKLWLNPDLGNRAAPDDNFEYFRGLFTDASAPERLFAYPHFNLTFRAFEPFLLIVNTNWNLDIGSLTPIWSTADIPIYPKFELRTAGDAEIIIKLHPTDDPDSDGPCVTLFNGLGAGWSVIVDMEAGAVTAPNEIVLSPASEFFAIPPGESWVEVAGVQRFASTPRLSFVERRWP